MINVEFYMFLWELTAVGAGRTATSANMLYKPIIKYKLYKIHLILHINGNEYTKTSCVTMWSFKDLTHINF